MDYLQANRGGAKYLVATESSMSASGIIIATGEPVMAIGGFSGADPALTPSQFADLVENGTVRYFLVAGVGGPPGAFAGDDGPLGQRPAGAPAGVPPLRNGPPGQRPGAQGGVPPTGGAQGTTPPVDGPIGTTQPDGPRAGTRAISQAITSAGKLVDSSAYGGTTGGGQLYDLQGTAAALRAAGGR